MATRYTSFLNDSDYRSPQSPGLIHDTTSSSPSESSPVALATPNEELDRPSYSHDNTSNERSTAKMDHSFHVSHAGEDDEGDHASDEGRVFHTNALDALEQDIYVRRQPSLGRTGSSPSGIKEIRHRTRSLRGEELLAPTPPPKDFDAKHPFNISSPASRSSAPVNATTAGNHRRTLSAKELIKVFEQADAQLLPPENGYQAARNNRKDVERRSHPSHAPPSKPPVPIPQTPPKQIRLLSPLSFSSPRKKPKPLEKLPSGGSSTSLNSMMAAVLAPSNSSGSGGMGASVKNGFQSLLGVFSPARKKKKRSMEELGDVAEEGFVVARNSKGIVMSGSSVSYLYASIQLPLAKWLTRRIFLFSPFARRM